MTPPSVARQARRSRELTPPSVAHRARRSRELTPPSSPSPPFAGVDAAVLTEPAVRGRCRRRPHRARRSREMTPPSAAHRARRSREMTPPSAAHQARHSREISAAGCGYPKPTDWFSGSRVAAPPSPAFAGVQATVRGSPRPAVRGR